MNNRFRALLAIALSLFFPAAPRSEQAVKTIHAFVALCDNDHQGIVPVPAALGNGDDPANNLYWGARYGVKTFFRNSALWELVRTIKPESGPVLERCVFRQKGGKAFLVADAYQGREIRQAVIDFLEAAAGQDKGKITISQDGKKIEVPTGGAAGLIAYVGHDGLMDFRLGSYPEKEDGLSREVIILACMSRSYFAEAVRSASATPLLWTTGLMAPEAYTLEAAVEGWIDGKSDGDIRDLAAAAYHKHQKCGLATARKLLVTGW